MAGQHVSLMQRSLVQIDRAFWCIHEHRDALIPLGLPTFLAMVLAVLAAVGVWRTWEFSIAINYLLLAVVCPTAALLIFTVLPLPCAVFAWQRAHGEVGTARECFAWCARRSGRLFWVVLRLTLMWLGSFILFGLPLLIVWPRTCVTPLVALFEDDPRVFRRSRRILREDQAVYIFAAIYLGLATVLIGLVATPRLLLATNALGAHILDEQWRHLVLEYLWLFEALSAALIVTALAMSWWISLTLLYHDIRTVREGDDLRHQLKRVRERILA